MAEPIRFLNKIDLDTRFAQYYRHFTHPVSSDHPAIIPLPETVSVVLPEQTRQTLHLPSPGQFSPQLLVPTQLFETNRSLGTVLKLGEINRMNSLWMSVGFASFVEKPLLEGFLDTLNRRELSRVRRQFTLSGMVADEIWLSAKMHTGVSFDYEEKAVFFHILVENKA